MFPGRDVHSCSVRVLLRLPKVEGTLVPSNRYHGISQSRIFVVVVDVVVGVR